MEKKYNYSVNGFFDGLKSPFYGFHFISRNPGLWKYCLIPVFIAFCVILFFWQLDLQFMPLLKFDFEALYFDKPTAEGWISYIYKLLWFLGYYVFSFFVKIFMFFYGLVDLVLKAIITIVLVSVLSSPVFDLLSEAVEKRISGKEIVNTSFSFRELSNSILIQLKVELLKILVLLSGLILLFLVNLVPGIGQLIYAFLSPLWTVWWTAFNFSDYSMSRRNWKFQDRIKLGLKNWKPFLGMGISLYVLVWIPILNFILFPLAVTAGTIFFVLKFDDSKKDPDLEIVQ